MQRDLSAVSVIVPVYNRRDVITRAVDSLLKQDFAHPYEIVVVDDGSTDDSAKVVQGTDPKVRVIRQENRGAAAARNTGIKAASAEVVCFLDSDDIAKPHRLSVLWEGLKRRPDVVLSFARSEDMIGAPFPGERLWASVDQDQVMFDPLLTLLRMGCIAYGMNLMTYRSIALACTTGRARFLAANDYDFVLRAALHGPFAFVNDVTVWCDRTRPDGISRNMGAVQVGCTVLALVQAVAKSGRKDSGVIDALRDRIERLWPSAFMQLFYTQRWRLCAQVAMVGLQHSRWSVGLRRLWWAMHYYKSATASPGSAV